MSQTEPQRGEASEAAAEPARESPMRRNLRVLLAALFITAGTRHLTDPGLFLPLMPPYLPAHLALVYLSGFCEIVLGLGLLFERTREPAGWGLLALLIAVFPANIHAAQNGIQLRVLEVPEWALWARLPLQGVLAWWVWWVIHGPPAGPRARPAGDSGADGT